MYSHAKDLVVVHHFLENRERVVSRYGFLGKVMSGGSEDAERQWHY